MGPPRACPASLFDCSGPDRAEGDARGAGKEGRPPEGRSLALFSLPPPRGDLLSPANPPTALVLVCRCRCPTHPKPPSRNKPPPLTGHWARGGNYLGRRPWCRRWSGVSTRSSAELCTGTWRGAGASVRRARDYAGPPSSGPMVPAWRPGAQHRQQQLRGRRGKWRTGPRANLLLLRPGRRKRRVPRLVLLVLFPQRQLLLLPKLLLLVARASPLVPRLAGWLGSNWPVARQPGIPPGLAAPRRRPPRPSSFRCDREELALLPRPPSTPLTRTVTTRAPSNGDCGREARSARRGVRGAGEPRYWRGQPEPAPL
jgi:hypothetical protein